MAARKFESAVCQCRQALHTIQQRSASKRTFSSSARHRKNGALPTFTDTTVPELNDLLSTLRNTIFLPSHLRSAQRKLVYQSRHRELLSSDPVSVEISSEQYTLQPLDITKDIPNSWKSVLRTMDLMGTAPTSWANFIGLLEGMKTAGRKWKPWQLERILRIAGDCGMAGIILEAARSAARTGIVLADVQVVREAFWGCRTKAVLEGWSEQGLESAVRYAEQFASLLEEERHAGRERLGDGDPRVQADIIGVVLELVAVKAEKFGQGKDRDGMVRVYVERVVPHLEGVRALVMGDEKGSLAMKADHEMCRWVPVVSGLEAAGRVLGKEMPGAELVGKKIKELKRKLEEAREIVEESEEPEQVKGKRKGLHWWKALPSRSR